MKELRKENDKNKKDIAQSKKDIADLRRKNGV